MAIQVQCKQCQASLRAPENAMGKRIRCPRCGNIVLVESNEPESASESAKRQAPQKSAVIVVPAKQPPSDANRNSQSIGNESRALQNRHVASNRENKNRNLLIAVMLMFVAILICVAAGAYWLGRSSPDSNTAVAVNDRPAPTTTAVPAVEHVANAPQTGTQTTAQEMTPDAAAPNAGHEPAPPKTEAVPSPAPQVTLPTLPASPVDFEPIQLDEPVTSLTMSEDGLFVMMSHQTAGLVSIFDVIDDKVVHVISTPTPRTLLSRGDQLFVASFDEAKISVYSVVQGWSLQNELQVTKPNIVYMAAACAENFAGEILVTCHGPGGQASYQDTQVYRVDAGRDRCDPISKSPMASVSFDGKNALTQDSFNLSPSGGLSLYSYDEYVAGDAEPVFRGGIQQTPFVYQSYAGSYWLSENMMFGGAPIGLVHENLGSIIIPDAKQKVIYVMDANTLSARRLNSSLSEIGDRPRKIKLPTDQSKLPSRLFHQVERRRHYLLDHPVAATHGNMLALFLLDQTNGAVLRARTAAFADVDRVQSPAPAPSAKKIAPEGRADSKPPLSMPTPEPSRTPAAKTVNLFDAWPNLIAAGKEFTHQFPVEKDKLQIQLIDGPSGMKVNPDGRLSWTPTNKDVGLHELKLRVELPSGPFFERPKVEVASIELAKSVDGDLTKVNQFESFDLDTDHFAVTKGVDQKLLLLQGKTLRILAADGISIERKVELPQRYHDIEERHDDYVAVSSKPPFLDVIDKKTLKIRKHVDLVFPDFKILDVTDLSIHPDLSTSYVCVKNAIELPRYTVLIVDEKSGTARAPGIVGTWSEVSPNGQMLYTGYSDIYEKGVTFHINPGWRLIEIPEYGSVDMLLAWTADDQKPTLNRIVRQAGGNGKGIRLSPDGGRIIYLSHVGTPMHSNNLVGFQTFDFEKNTAHYETKDRASTNEAAFHPTLPWVAMPGTGSVTIFQQDTGALIENRLLATLGGIGPDAIERLFFSPDGRSIVLLRSGGASGRYMQRIPLILNDAEMAAAPRIGKSKPLPQPKQKVVPASKLNSLELKAAKVSATPLEIGRDFMKSVVVVKTSTSSGSGFIVGDSGYVLTCAHVVGNGDQLSVAYHSSDNQDSFTTCTADVIRIDHDKDIALLKFTPKDTLMSVRFCEDQPMESGEPVTVIGNPGAGDAILSHTMTSGIVSNPKRDFDGQIFIQLSAAVNPGNSGGPLFDQHGNVAGLVALKARIEGASFAVPSETLKKFLREAVRTP